MPACELRFLIVVSELSMHGHAMHRWSAGWSGAAIP